MNPDNGTTEEDEFLYQGLAFFGAITASVTHELNNVLGTIEQITGLMEDMAYTATQGKPITPEQVNDVVERSNRQSERGIALVKRLNAFAHSTDAADARLDLGETLRNLMALVERLARIKKVDLAVSLPDTGIFARGSSFLLQQAVFRVIRLALSQAPENSRLEVTVTQGHGEATIGIAYTSSGSIDDAIDPYLEKLAARFSGRLERDVAADSVKIDIILPLCE